MNILPTMTEGDGSDNITIPDSITVSTDPPPPPPPQMNVSTDLPPAPRLNETNRSLTRAEPIRKCTYCDFVSKTKFGYMSHMVSKHKDNYSKDFPGAKMWTNRGRPKKMVPLPKIPLLNEYEGEEVKMEKIGSGLVKEDMVVPPVPKAIPPPSKFKKPVKITDDYDADDIEDELSDDPAKGVYKATQNRKPINLTGKDLYIAELLINNGFARDLSEVHKKSLRLAFSLLNAGNLGNQAGGTNAFGEPLTEKKVDVPVEQMLEQIEKNEIRELQLEQLRSKLANKVKGGKKMESSDLMMILAMTGGLGGNKQQGGDSMTQALEIAKLLQSQQPQNNSAIEMVKMIELIKSLNPPQPQQDWKQNLEIARMMLESSKQNNGNNVVDILKTLNSKNQEDMARQLELQRMRDEHNQKIMELKLQQVQSELNKPHAEMNFEKLKDTISVVRELNEEIGGGKEPSTFDYIESLGKNLSGPLTEILKSRNQQRAMPPPQQAFQEEGEGGSEEEVIHAHRQKMNIPPSKPVSHQEEEVTIIPRTRPEIKTKNTLEYTG